MIIRTNQYCFFDKRRIGKVRKLKKAFGVKHNSYAGKTILRLYDQYFGNAYNVNKYYKKYYRKEFPSCEEFLICKYNLSGALAQEIVENNLCCVNMEFKGDRIGYSFENDEELASLFKEYVGGIRNEN